MGAWQHSVYHLLRQATLHIALQATVSFKITPHHSAWHAQLRVCAVPIISMTTWNEPTEQIEYSLLRALRLMRLSPFLSLCWAISMFTQHLKWYMPSSYARLVHAHMPGLSVWDLRKYTGTTFPQNSLNRRYWYFRACKLQTHLATFSLTKSLYTIVGAMPYLSSKLRGIYLANWIKIAYISVVGLVNNNLLQQC